MVAAAKAKAKAKEPVATPQKASAKPAKAVKAKVQPAVLPPLDAPLPKGKLRSAVLEEAWRGWPALERFGLYVHRADSDAFVCYHKFAACYAARKFIEAAAAGAELKMLPNGDLLAGRHVFRSPNTERFGDASKACASMKEVYDHKYTKEEEEWVLPVPYDGYAASLAGIKQPLQQRIEEGLARVGIDPIKQSQRDKAEPRAKAARGPRVAGSGGALAIKDDMPWDQKVRRMAKTLCGEANGGDLSLWRTFKPAAERRLKEAEKK
jgi:hypothetical protein